MSYTVFFYFPMIKAAVDFFLFKKKKKFVGFAFSVSNQNPPGLIKEHFCILIINQFYFCLWGLNRTNLQ